MLKLKIYTRIYTRVYISKEGTLVPLCKNKVSNTVFNNETDTRAFGDFDVYVMINVDVHGVINMVFIDVHGVINMVFIDMHGVIKMVFIDMHASSTTWSISMSSLT